MIFQEVDRLACLLSKHLCLYVWHDNCCWCNVLFYWSFHVIAGLQTVEAYFSKCESLKNNNQKFKLSLRSLDSLTTTLITKFDQKEDLQKTRNLSNWNITDNLLKLNVACKTKNHDVFPLLFTSLHLERELKPKIVKYRDLSFTLLLKLNHKTYWKTTKFPFH